MLGMERIFADFLVNGSAKPIPRPILAPSGIGRRHFDRGYSAARL